MAIIYTYPNLPLSSLSADDLLVITNVDATNNNPTKSVTLADIATYVTGTGSGTGTTNKIVKFTDGANGLLGDSIMTESTGLIDLAGQFVSTSSPTLTQAAPVSGIKAILNGTTAAPNVALYGDSKHTGGTQADSNYGLYAKGEFEGTGGFTGFAIGGNLEGRYDGTGTNGANASVYGSFSSARATSAANGTISYMIGANNTAKIESANVTAANLQGAHTGVNLTNGTAGDVIVQILDFDGTGGTVTGDLSYLQIQNDTMPTVAGTKRAINSKSVLPSLFTGQVEIPLVPTINAHATSKQYVDQQISNVVSGLVFISTWDARTQAQGGLAGDAGNPDLSDASKKVVGHYYVVATAGSATPNGAGTLPNSWNVGDWCIYVEQGATDRWEKLDQTFVSGAGAAGQVTYWNSQNEVAGDNDLFFDSTNKRLGIGNTTPATALEVNGLISGKGGAGWGYTFSGDLDTSIENPSANTIGFKTTGVERLRVDSAGDIFISPRDTAASSGSGILYFKNVDDNSATITGGSIRTVDSVNNPSGADMRFQVADDNGTLFDMLTIISSGFVGIGTTAPDVELDVSGKGRFQRSTGEVLKLNSTTVNGCFATWENNNVDIGYIGSSFHLWNAPNNVAANFGIRANTQLDLGIQADVYMTIKSTGNVGIGTTSPTTTLQVGGLDDGNNYDITLGWNAVAGDAVGTKRSALTFKTGQNSVNQEDIYKWDIAMLAATATNGSENFGSDLAFLRSTRSSTDVDAVTMLLSRTGKVGIGTDDPFAKLSVKDGTDINLGIKIGQTDTTAVMLNAYNDAVTDNIPMEFRASKFNFENGNVGIGNISPGAKLDVKGDGAEFYIRSLDHSVARIIPRGQTGANIDKGLLSLFDTGTEDVRIDTEGNSWFNGGNVGIGNITPQEKLYVYNIGDARIEVEGTTGVAGLKATNNQGSFAWYIPNNADNFRLFDFTDSADRITIDGDGNTTFAGDVSLEKTTGSVFNLKRDDTSIVSGDDLGSIFFQGNDPSSPYKSGVAILGQGDGTWNMGSPNVYPSRLVFQTAEQNILKTAMVIKSDQKVGIGTDSPVSSLNITTTKTVALDTAAKFLTLGLTVDDLTAGNTAGGGGGIAFRSKNDNAGTQVVFGAIDAIKEAANVSDFKGSLRFFTNQNSTGVPLERMRIDSSGHVLIGGTAIQAVGALTFDKSAVGFTITNNVTSSAVNNHEFQVYRFNSTQIGSITMSGTSGTAYNTSSDYRLKKDLKDFDGLDKVSKIPVYDFKWKVDDSNSYGVMAHELQEVLPDAVSGEKDGEEMQGVDYSKIVPLLIKSIQELEAKVKILENK